METFLGEEVVRDSDPTRERWLESPDGILSWLDVLQKILKKRTAIQKTSMEDAQCGLQISACTSQTDTVFEVEVHNLSLIHI